MKILFPIGTFYPATVGGSNLSVYWLTRELKKHGIEPIIITIDYGIKEEHNIKFNKWIDTDYGRVIYKRDLCKIGCEGGFFMIKYSKN